MTNPLLTSVLGPGSGKIPALVDDDVVPAVLLQVRGDEVCVLFDLGLGNVLCISIPTVPAHRRGGREEGRLGRFRSTERPKAKRSKSISGACNTFQVNVTLRVILVSRICLV